MNCTSYTANPIAQCAGTVHVGQLTTGTDWILRVVNVASGRMDYVTGTGVIDLVDFAFSPGSTYALSLTEGTFRPYMDSSTIGTIEVDMIYVKVDKVFDGNGDIYEPSGQWIIMAQ